MHALIKSEAYYLTHDPVIQQWENRATIKRQAESLRNRLQYTGRAYTGIFMLVMQEKSVKVIACGYSFVVNAAFVHKNVEHFLALQQDHTQFLKYLRHIAESCAA